MSDLISELEPLDPHIPTFERLNDDSYTISHFPARMVVSNAFLKYLHDGPITAHGAMLEITTANGRAVYRYLSSDPENDTRLFIRLYGEPIELLRDER